LSLFTTCPDWLWGLPSFLPTGFWDLSDCDWDMKFTTHLHLVLKLRTCGATTPLPQHVFKVWFLIKHKIRSYSMMLRKAQGKCYLYLYFASKIYIFFYHRGNENKIMSNYDPCRTSPSTYPSHTAVFTYC
jgi:hypothetical protein